LNDEQLDRLVQVIAGHGDQLGGNLVYLKGFLKAQQEEQHKFLTEQREKSDRAQLRANWTAVFAAIAAGAAALAAIAQASVAVMEWRGANSPVQVNSPPTATAPATKH
jgi:hypothetical protein